MVFLIKKSVAKEILKSLGKNKLEELKREVIEILKKQDEKEYKKALSQFENEEKNMSCLEKSNSGEWIEKAGYGIGTVRVWKGKKYKKIAPGKWARMYEKEGRGTNIAVGHLIAKVKKIDDVEELMNFVMQNKQRFQDENGMDLPILDKIRAEVDRQSGKIESKGKSENTEKKEEKYTDNAKFVKEVKGDVWEEWNTDPNKFAVIYDKNTGKSKGLRMTQDIVDIINSVVEPSVLDWQDNVAEKVHKKYPEIKEGYIKENIKQIRMGYRNGSQEKIQILNKESEAEKHQNRSEAMKGNKNAYKGDPKEVAMKNPKTKLLQLADAVRNTEEGTDEYYTALSVFQNAREEFIENQGMAEYKEIMPDYPKGKSKKPTEKTEESSDSLREKYKEKDKEYSEIIRKLIYARDHDQDTSKYDEKATKIQKELSDIENKIKNAEDREVKRSGKPSDFTLDDINSQKTVKTIEDFEDVIKEIDKIKDDYEAADKYMDFLASNIEGGFGGKLRRAIKRKYKSENLRDLAREVKGRKPLDTRDVSYADEYANKEEEKSKKKENSKNIQNQMTPKQQKTFDDFEKKAIKNAGNIDRGKRFAKHNYNIDGEDWTITTDGRVMLCSREKFEEPTKTDKITNMDKVFVINGQKESAIPDGIDAIIKAAPKKVVVGKDYKGKEKKELSIIKLGDRYFNTDYLKTVQNFLGPLSNAKMQVIPGDNKSRVKFESGNKAVVLLPIENGAELENRIVNTNDIKKSLEDIIMFCNDFEDEDDVIEEINNESLFSDYSAENPSEFNSIKYRVANAFEECGY